MRIAVSAVAPAALEPLRAIVGRMRGAAFVGDIAGDLWKLEQTPRPWSGDSNSHYGRDGEAG